MASTSAVDSPVEFQLVRRSLSSRSERKIERAKGGAYTTGLDAYLLFSRYAAAARAAAMNACRWLNLNQNAEIGPWPTPSHNQVHGLSSLTGQFTQARATAFVVLALCESEYETSASE